MLPTRPSAWSLVAVVALVFFVATWAEPETIEVGWTRRAMALQKTNATRREQFGQGHAPHQGHLGEQIRRTVAGEELLKNNGAKPAEEEDEGDAEIGDYDDYDSQEVRALATPCGIPAIPPCWHQDAAPDPVPHRYADLAAAALTHCPTALLDQIRAAATATAATPGRWSDTTFPSWDERCHRHRQQAHQPSYPLAGAPGGGPSKGVFKPRYQDKDAVKSFVRRWVEENDEELAIAETYHVFRDAAEITLAMLERLPENFVFKGTHGSGMVMIVKGKVCTRSPPRAVA